MFAVEVRIAVSYAAPVDASVLNELRACGEGWTSWSMVPPLRGRGQVAQEIRWAQRLSGNVSHDAMPRLVQGTGQRSAGGGSRQRSRFDWRRAWHAGVRSANAHRRRQLVSTWAVRSGVRCERRSSGCVGRRRGSVIVIRAQKRLREETLGLLSWALAPKASVATPCHISGTVRLWESFGRAAAR